MEELKADRPDALRDVTQRLSTGWGKLYVIITEGEDGAPFEVFVNTGASGDLYNAQAEAIGKTVSTALRMADDRHAAAEELAEQLIGIRTSRAEDDNGDVIYSIPDAIGIALRRHVQDRIEQPVRGEDDGLHPHMEED